MAPQDNEAQDDNSCLGCLESPNPSATFITLPCGHRWCPPCLQMFLRITMTHEMLFPPRCHKCSFVFPPELIRAHLTSEEYAQFERAVVEFGTTDRVYCSVPTCSAFIPPTRINKHRASCGDCGAHTCPRCKETFHVGPCKRNAALEGVRELSKKEGWKECRRCGNMVEKGEGCRGVQ
jgi:hypothetical protein